MKEFELLKIVSEFFGDENVPVPATKHDAAYVKLGEEYLVLTCDTVNEISDFPPYMEPVEYGYMAFAVTLSDIAACGADPLYMLTSISLKEANESLFRKILEGMKRIAKKYDFSVVGGDIDFSEVLTIASFAVGKTGKIITVSGAKPGDRVYVTGGLGKAELCLEMLREGYKREDLPYPEKLYTPEPRIKEGKNIAEFATSLTDISDSLAVSLHNISSSSGVKIVLSEDLIELNHLTKFVSKDKALDLYLYGGGDFELVFTAESSDLGTEIGKVIEGQGVFIEINGELKPVEFRGYEHF